jgi:hypothetical protein
MRIDAIASDTSRAAAAIATRAAAPVQSQRPSQLAKPAAKTADADGDHDGDTGTKGGRVDIDA